MTSSQMKAKLDERPFMPFRIHVSDGMELDILHPNHAMVMSGVFAVGIDPDPDDNDPTRLLYIDPHHVARMETLRKGRDGMHRQ